MESKNPMKYLLLFVFITLGAVVSARGQNTPATEDIPTVAFCDLLRHPELYDQKTVRVQAVYRYGFEWSELYCLSCLESGRTWVDFGDLFNSSTKPKVAKKISDGGDKGRTVNIVAVGKFYGSGRHGHLGGYNFKFVISCLEQAEVILNDSPVPSALPEKASRRVQCNRPATPRKNNKESRQR
jgi:hypothetical protein